MPGMVEMVRYATERGHAVFDVVASFGDQDSDLVGGCCDKTFTLPTPSHYVS